MSTDKEQMKCLSDIQNFIENPNKFKTVGEVIAAFSNIPKSSFCDMTPEVAKQLEMLMSKIEYGIEKYGKQGKQEGGKYNKKSRKTRKMRKQTGGDNISVGIAIVVFVVAFGFLVSAHLNERSDETSQRLRALRGA